MGYTGYKVIQYIDDNPNSPTYGETWTELVLDTEHCPNGSGDWELVSSNCELSTSGYTGRRVYTYYNNVTNEYSSTTSADSSCKTSSLDEIWTNSGDSYCEVDEDGKYTGYGLQRQVQTNSNLINYKEIRDVRVTKTECMDELEPVWQDLYKVCHIESSVYGTLYYDGTADILQIDINPSSSSYNQTRTINVPDEECIAIVCDEIEEEWKYVDDYCGNQVPASYNLPNLTYNTVYHIYQKYQKCIVEGTTVRETPTGIYSAQTYQTGVEDCKYRWIDSEETVCIGSKISLRYSNSDVYEKPCDSNTALTSGETKPSGYDHTLMTSAEIGDCVTSIGTYVFYNCYNLTSCAIGSGVTSIGDFAFNFCTNLSSIDIPDSVTSIGNGVFQNCYNLTSCTIGSGVTSIGDYTFANCSGLTSIDIPSGVTSIGVNAFSFCIGLTAITVNATIPPTLSDANAFYDTNNCPIYVPCASINAYKTASGWSNYANRIQCFMPPLTGKFRAMYSNYDIYEKSCDSTTTLESGETRPSGYVFSSMTTTDIGSCVSTIGTSAFTNCSSLSSVTISNGVYRVGKFAFYNCGNIAKIDIPDSVTYIDNYAFQRCSGMTSLKLGNGVLSIGNSSFSTCYALTSLNIPNSVSTIGGYAFSNCSGITSLTIGSGVTSIGQLAFNNCSGLTSVSIPNNVTSIGNQVFGYCNGLRSATIGSGITSISTNAFFGCKSLTSVTLSNNLTYIGTSAFYGCISLTSIGLVGSGASIEIPSSVTGISNSFASCSGLTSVTIPSTVTSMGGSIFSSCRNLNSITILATTPPTLGQYAFDFTNNCPIYVPSESVNAYKTATNWSTWASRITAIPNS